ncbi:MAG: tetratricopeptide repeat protein [Alphaproteobacteria bacterium]|nr:tetratricopeptide repeat protein [Alphaproteobacteria bacterium]MBV9370400.1 tetratricopeptide repeat protein [Alphaproteobacteria bacterium]MBV9900333.1 tetratricopeptide repeat protein [Alphaproteobacteria bacterium]
MTPDAKLLHRPVPDDLPTAGAAPEAPSPGRTIALNADFARRGVWAGVEDLVEQAYLDLRAKGLGDVLERHNYELHLALPRHRDGMPLAYASLTDTATGAEKTRNFPLDRAYRLVHGLVGLVLEWRAASPEPGTWTILVGRFDDSQHLARRFFIELARRAAPRGDILVLAETGSLPGGTALDLHASAPVVLGAEARQALESLERPDGEDGNGRLAEAVRLETMEEHYPELLAHYRRIGDDRSAALIALKALCLYNHYGYYHESGSFVDTVLPQFDALVRDEADRWNYIGNIFQGLVTIGRLDEARRIIETLAEPQLTRPDLRAKMSYLLSMVYLRYAARPDLALAEKHILAAVDYIDAAEGTIDPDDFHFMKVFIDNGLAFLRVRQGRQAEALHLCQAGYERLTTALGEERHRLHRSVLQYNTAQVYVALDQLDAALVHYAKSIQMDPYYSEYYNESGNILQRQERYEEALAAYDLAIRYSAPYPEVFFNKAVCETQLGRWEEALASFATSLEMEPRQPEAYLLRAEVLSALDRDEEALADLDAVVAADGDAVTARVNRAVLRFNRAQYDLALVDMDHVVALDAGNPEQYENRAEIHKAMGRADLHADDLRRAGALRAAA